MAGLDPATPSNLLLHFWRADARQMGGRLGGAHDG